MYILTSGAHCSPGSGSEDQIGLAVIMMNERGVSIRPVLRSVTPPEITAGSEVSGSNSCWTEEDRGLKVCEGLRARGKHVTLPDVSF
ncbi:hypothetical protein KUCAC02_034331 [Chaenocephalus aceratus]|nr:hypothetical protein KUCAC02_034331 [Chaenocephalus aceratus]